MFPWGVRGRERKETLRENRRARKGGRGKEKGKGGREGKRGRRKGEWGKDRKGKERGDCRKSGGSCGGMIFFS